SRRREPPPPRPRSRPPTAPPSRPGAGHGRRREPPTRPPPDNVERWQSRSRFRRRRSRSPPCQPGGHGRRAAGVGAARRRNPAGSLVTFRLGREAEDPLADDVALDLVGTTVNGLGPREEKRALEVRHP